MNPKEIELFYLPSCPYCKQALQWLEELKREDQRYSSVQVKLIDERMQKELADSRDYYLVPTFFVGGKKVHEGVASKPIVARALDLALTEQA